MCRLPSANSRTVSALVVADLLASAEGVEGAAGERDRHHRGQHAADLAVAGPQREQAGEIPRAWNARREHALEGAREVDLPGREVLRQMEHAREPGHVALLELERGAVRDAPGAGEVEARRSDHAAGGRQRGLDVLEIEAGGVGRQAAARVLVAPDAGHQAVDLEATPRPARSPRDGRRA